MFSEFSFPLLLSNVIIFTLDSRFLVEADAGVR